MIIIRIQNLYNVAGQVFLFHRLLVIAAVEGIKLEIIDSLRIPHTQGVHQVVAVADNRDIVRNCLYRLISILDKLVSAGLFVIFYADITAEFNDLCVFRTAQLKRIAVFKPVIGHLYLISVLNLLLEHTVVIADPAAVCLIPEGCQRIKEAGRQPSQTAVAQRRVAFLILNQVDVKSHLIERFPDILISPQVDKIVAQGTPDQKFHGHIVNNLRIVFLKLFLACQPVINNNVLYCVADCLKNFLLRSFR